MVWSTVSVREVACAHCPHSGSSAEKPWNCKGLYGDSAEAAVNRIESVERPWSNISPHGNRSADAPMKRRAVVNMRSDSEVAHGSSNAEKPWNAVCPLLRGASRYDVHITGEGGSWNSACCEGC